MNRQKGFILLGLLILCVGLIVSCGKAKTPSESEYVPDKNSDDYIAALDALETADKFMDLIVDMQTKAADPAYSQKLDELHTLGFALLDGYAEKTENDRDMLSALYTLEEAKGSSEIVLAYTNLLQASVSVVAFDARTYASEQDLIEFLDIDLLKSRNDLADVLGVETRK